MSSLFALPWLPFYAAAAFIIVVGSLAYRYPSWREQRWTAIQVSASVVTAAAALSIPLVLDRNARDTRTLDVLNDINRTVGKAIATKIRIDNNNKKSRPETYDYSYITNDAAIQGLVFKILNEYDYICLGGNEKLLSNTIIKRLRFDALNQTWSDYGPYMKAHRDSSPSRAAAWIECDRWLRENRAR